MPSSGHPIRRLHQDLEIHGRCGELRLDRLSRAEVERYLALRFGDDALASTLSGPVFERTQGQPLFMASLLKYFIDQRVIVETDGGWHLSSETAIAQESVPTDLVRHDHPSGRPSHGARTAPARYRQRSGCGIFGRAGGRRLVGVTPSRSNAIWMLGPQGSHACPVRRIRMAGWHLFGVICLPSHSLSECHLSATRAGTAGADAQAPGASGWRRPIPTAPEIASMLALHFELGRDFVKRLALPRTGGGEFCETPGSRGSRQLSRPGRWVFSIVFIQRIS